MKTFELIPKNGRKSFNHKAIVNEYINSLMQVKSDLISYTTKVATFNHDTNKMQVFGYYSPTTAIHINSFLDYYGFNTCNKKELENYIS